MKIQVVRYAERGNPRSVCVLEEIDLAPPAPGEATVRMLLAPINPADLNMIEGTYAIRPNLPAIPGGEGVGEVEALGSGVHGLEIGSRVLLPAGSGTWAQACNVEAQRLALVPEGIELEQAAMLRVNPATALRMLRDFVAVERGSWVIQNGANSGVGRAAIRIAREEGIRTVNVVRRPELVEELKAEGADVVLVEGEDLVESVKAATSGAPIALALNCVGGESALRLALTLQEGGTVVTYGAMSRQPLRIPNGLLIFNDLSWRGFWVTRWYQRASLEARQAMLAELFAWAKRGVLRTPIDQIFALADFSEAIGRAQESKRAGKILLNLSSGPR